jgi:polar amino acid transport system substrate-binding protein
MERAMTFRTSLSLVLLLASGAFGADPAVLRVGMDTRSRPWAFVPGLDYSKEDWQKPPRITPSQMEELQGLDIDFVKALAARLGATLKIVPAAWQHIEEGLVSKDFDVLVNAWVPNSRTPAAIVAVPYCDWGLVVAVRADNRTIESYKDLEGRTVGHFADPAVQRSVDTLHARKALPFEDSDQLFDALGAGTLEAAIEDSTYALWRVAHDPTFKVVGDPLNKLSYSVGLRKDDAALQERVEAAVRDLVQTGEVARIKKRWASPEAPGLGQKEKP